MGGLSAAALLAKGGRDVLVLEANYLPGGCSSSYWHKGYIFETGATTLMGFDAGQPLDLLQQSVPLIVIKQELNPAMQVWIDGQCLTRWKDRIRWVEECIRVFGQAEAQRKFWKLVYELSDFVWRVSGRNLRFPPTSIGDLAHMAVNNSPLDFPRLRYMFHSTLSILKDLGLASNEPFVRFLDQQLMITAQAHTAQTPMLFAAPALSYTNYSNFYLPGGMIRLPFATMAAIGQYGGDVRLRCRVEAINHEGGVYFVHDSNGNEFQSRQLLSNLPIWDTAQLCQGRLRSYLEKQISRMPSYWGAYTMGIVIKGELPAELPLHHQFILPSGESLPETNSHSVFVSISAADDFERAPIGHRVLAISTHAANPASWFGMEKAAYALRKQKVRDAIVRILQAQLPGFAAALIVLELTSSPASWYDWTLRHEGTVGGIPQSLNRPIYQWTGSRTPERGFHLCGDTVYPGQGIPGVTLGGIIAAKRMMSE
jgi:C-3',4' desaturase CrtD